MFTNLKKSLNSRIFTNFKHGSHEFSIYGDIFSAFAICALVFSDVLFCAIAGILCESLVLLTARRYA